MGYYPVWLDLTGRPCLVVGGGPVAERKVEGLLAVAARVTVVSPTLTSRLAAWARQGRLAHRARPYRAGDLDGQQLGFVTTDDPAVTAAVAAEGRARGVWVNAADDPTHCDFILPALLRRGPLAIGVATGGASPALSRLVRDELADAVPEAYARLATVAAEVRQALRRRGVAGDGAAWRAALEEARALVAAGRDAEARDRLLARLGAAPDAPSASPRAAAARPASPPVPPARPASKAAPAGGDPAADRVAGGWPADHRAVSPA